MKNMYISFVASPLIKYKQICTSLGEIKAIFNKKIEYPLYICQIYYPINKDIIIIIIIGFQFPNPSSKENILISPKTFV